MPHLLHIDSSGRRDNSVTRRLTAVYAETWRQHNPGAPVTYRDLVRDPVTHIDEDATSVIWVPAEHRDTEQEHAWWAFEELLREVEAADTFVLGVPMYNFGIPSAFKAWLDRVAGIPGRSFDVGAGGLLAGKDVTIITGRGGAYGPGTPRHAFDFQTSYLREVFRELMGIDDVRFEHAEMTNATVFPALADFQDFAVESLAAAEAGTRAAAAARAATLP